LFIHSFSSVSSTYYIYCKNKRMRRQLFTMKSCDKIRREKCRGDTAMKKFQETTIHTEKIYDGKIVQLQVDDVTLPNGKKSKRELVKHSGAVAVIPITKDNKIVFVEQYRKPL